MKCLVIRVYFVEAAKRKSYSLLIYKQKAPQTAHQSVMAIRKVRGYYSRFSPIACENIAQIFQFSLSPQTTTSLMPSLSPNARVDSFHMREQRYCEEGANR